MFKADASTIYFTDNDATYCGDHLGASAKATGRDISGQPILAVSKHAARVSLAMGYPVACEKCGKAAATTPAGSAR
jgi:hypothetical protein